jgi:hypothetical protein
VQISSETNSFCYRYFGKSKNPSDELLAVLKEMFPEKNAVMGRYISAVETPLYL